MVSFENDYSEGAHERILQVLADTNREQCRGYGIDPYCEKARAVIQELIECPEAEIHFLVGGTQTNQTAISAFLRPWEAAVSASTGHICVHETGAVEATGHKVIAVPHCQEGKLTPEALQKAVGQHTDEHMVLPRLVYLSDSTELGTVYTKEELAAVSSFCRNNGLLLYLDGARLGSALCSESNNLTLPDLARLTDAFSIGGTKNGALFGEALVLCRPELGKGFRHAIKQRGGMLAKGWLAGIQFYELFRDGLYFDLARHANGQAARLQKSLERMGVPFAYPPQSNQLFVTLPDAALALLETEYLFTFWDKPDASHTTIRIVTSWATEERHTAQLICRLSECLA